MEPEQLESYRKAGKIAGEALAYGRELIKPGVKLLEVTEKIEKFIFDKGGSLAFPVNISMNEIAAHYCAKKDDDFVFKDEIVKLDVGAHIDGYIGDTACTVDLSGKYSELVKATREALENAIKIVKPGVEIGEIGKVIEETIKGLGFKPVRNLSGHGVDQYITHTHPTIPNFDNNDGEELEEGMVFAIEPFATDGSGMIKSTKNAEIFSMHRYKPMRVGFVRQILKYLEKTYQLLPFSRRDLLKRFSEAQIGYTLKQLKEIEIVEEYTPLVEISGGMVSQAEHTILVTKDGCEVLTRVSKS